MRSVLSQYDGQRKTFEGTFICLSRKTKRGTGYVVLLKNINTVKGVAVTDHVWVSGASFIGLKLTEGTRIRFSAEVQPYKREWKGKERNYELNEYGLFNLENIRVCGNKSKKQEAN